LNYGPCRADLGDLGVQETLSKGPSGRFVGPVERIWGTWACRGPSRRAQVVDLWTLSNGFEGPGRSGDPMEGPRWSIRGPCRVDLGDLGVQGTLWKGPSGRFVGPVERICGPCRADLVELWALSSGFEGPVERICSICGPCRADLGDLDVQGTLSKCQSARFLAPVSRIRGIDESLIVPKWWIPHTCQSN